MEFSGRNTQKRGDNAVQIEQRVHFDGGFVAPEMSPGEQRQAEVDGAGIEGLEGGVEFDAEGIMGVEPPGEGDQHLGKIGEDAPIARLVGVGQCGASDVITKTQVIEFRFERTQASLDVAEAFAIGQLRERQGPELVPARKTAEALIAVITFHARRNSRSGRKLRS